MFWKKRLKSFLVNDQYKVTEAFQLNGKTYYQFEDAFNMPAGRALCALSIYEELRMRCTLEYLHLHVRACEKVFEDPKRININILVQLNSNLKDRLNLAPFPDHLYKLASVNFFDDSESPYNYDFKYNQKKIEEWKASGGMLDFFSQRLMPELMKSLQLSGESVATFSQAMEELNQQHLMKLREILSSSN